MTDKKPTVQECIEYLDRLKGKMRAMAKERISPHNRLKVLSEKGLVENLFFLTEIKQRLESQKEQQPQSLDEELVEKIVTTVMCYARISSAGYHMDKKVYKKIRTLLQQRKPEKVKITKCVITREEIEEFHRNLGANVASRKVDGQIIDVYLSLQAITIIENMFKSKGFDVVETRQTVTTCEDVEGE